MRPISDEFMLPTLFVCAGLLTVLVVVGGAYVYRNRAQARDVVRRMAADIEARPAKTYEVSHCCSYSCVPRDEWRCR